MQRQALDNGTWFDKSKAERFEEDTRWDGNNHISLATGSQWDHEVMWRTKGGTWVLNCWSQWQGSGESWEVVGPERAARWLVRNGHEVPELEAEQAALEV